MFDTALKTKNSWHAVGAHGASIPSQKNAGESSRGCGVLITGMRAYLAGRVEL
jgi:hypothetical protein